MFKANRWLAKNEGDKKIEVELAIDMSSDDQGKKKIVDSSSSWNSSEDEDSVSFSGKNKNQQFIKPPANNLNQIDELNETNASRLSQLINQSGNKKRFSSNVSDFGDSDQDDEYIKNPNLSKLQSKSLSINDFDDSFDQSKKSNDSKQTLGQLFVKNNLSGKKKSGIQSPRSDYEDKSQSIGSLINTVDILIDPKKAKKEKGDKNDNSGLRSIVKSVLSNNEISSDISTPRSISELDSKKSKKIKSPNKISSLADRIRLSSTQSKKSSKQQDLSDFSENDSKSESIGDMIRTVDNIIDVKKPKKSQSEHAIESLVPTGFQSASSSKINDEVEGLSSLLRKEFKKHPNEFFGTMSGSRANSQGSKSPEQVEGLSNLLREEFKKHPNEFFGSRLDNNKSEQVEGLSSLLKKEFTNHQNEFFVSSLNEDKHVKNSNVEGLSSLVKKEFNTNGNEFIPSAVISERNRPPSISSFENSFSSNPTSPQIWTKSINNNFEHNNHQPSTGLSNLLNNEFSGNKNEFFGSVSRKLSDTSSVFTSGTKSPDQIKPSEYKGPIMGLTSLLKEEFTNHSNEFFVSSLNDRKSSNESGKVLKLSVIILIYFVNVPDSVLRIISFLKQVFTKIIFTGHF